MNVSYIKSLKIPIMTLILALLFIGGCCYGSKSCDKAKSCSGKKSCPMEEMNKKDSSAMKAQTMCPVMGGKIDKSLYADVKGYRIYVCCPGCIDQIKKNPDKYIKKLQKMGVKIEKAPKIKKG